MTSRSAFGSETYRDKLVQLFSGRAGDGVPRVALRFGDRIIDVPLSGRWFLAEFADRPDEFLSYDANGSVLERRDFNWQMLHRRGTPAVRPPHQVTRAREVARIRARGGSEEVTRESDRDDTPALGLTS